MTYFKGLDISFKETLCLFGIGGVVIGTITFLSGVGVGYFLISYNI